MPVESLSKLGKQLRRKVLELIYRAEYGHPGGSLSVLDILVCLYFEIMRIDPTIPQWPERDRLILSKGHASAALYTVLAHRGYFDPVWLEGFAKLDSKLQGHPDMRNVPGVDFTSGSLGQGLSAAIGMALGAKMKNLDFQTFVVVGDGELQEGQCWEGALFAAEQRVSNLTMIVDCNQLQQNSPTPRIMHWDNLGEIMTSIGWRVQTISGHNYPQLVDALSDAKNEPVAPSCIIARTIKGHGISFMENNVEWHVRLITDVDWKQIEIELEKVDEQ